MTGKFFATILSCFLALDAHCDERLSSLIESLSGNRVTMEYSFRTSDGKVTLGSGTVVINGNWYFSHSKGLDIYCDAQTRWLVDYYARELYIEDAGGSADYILSMENYLQNVQDFRMTSDSASGIFVDPSNGECVRFSFSGMKFGDLVDDVSEFRFSPDGLGQDWVVTDLRN